MFKELRLALCRSGYAGTEEMRRSVGAANSGDSGDIGETGEDKSSESLTGVFCGGDTDRFDFEEEGRATGGKAEYDARFPPCLCFFTITVPVEFVEESEESDSLAATGCREYVAYGFEADRGLEVSALEGTLGSCTMSSEARPLSLEGRSSRKLVLVSIPGMRVRKG